MAGAFQLFHHSQYLRPHRRGQQDGSREHDCQQNQSQRTPRKKEISQAKNRLREPTSPAEIESVLSAIWGKSGRQNGRQAEILSATQKIPKQLKGLGIRNAGGGGLPRTKKQSTGLFFAHCGAPFCSTPQHTEIKNNSPAGIRLGSCFLCRWWGSNPHGVTTNGF